MTQAQRIQVELKLLEDCLAYGKQESAVLDELETQVQRQLARQGIEPQLVEGCIKGMEVSGCTF